MKLKIIFLIFPAILTAGNIKLSSKNHQGESSYIVNSNNSQNLKSKLVFPFDFNTFDLKYEFKFQDFAFNILSSFLLNQKNTKGQDYDWKNDNLTVYSKSNNKIDKYQNFSMQIKKSIFYLKFNYKILNMYWTDTYQKDYIQNSNTYISKKTLKFEQKFYQYHLGIDFKKNISKNINLKLSPSLIYAYVNTKDTHILRNFYTIQNTQSFGYEINAEFNYNIKKFSFIGLSLSYITLKDKNVNMDYYNSLNEKYLSYPSTYNYKDKIIGIYYNYIFNDKSANKSLKKISDPADF